MFVEFLIQSTTSHLLGVTLSTEALLELFRPGLGSKDINDESRTLVLPKLGKLMRFWVNKHLEDIVADEKARQMLEERARQKRQTERREGERQRRLDSLENTLQEGEMLLHMSQQVCS